LPDINFTAVAVAFGILLFSLTVHEMAHAWTADRLGDSTARRLGRVSFNPLVHADPIGTGLFPLLAMIGNFPLIGWAKPVPVDVRQLSRPRRDFLLIAAAGPASNLLLAYAGALAFALLETRLLAASSDVTVWTSFALNRFVQLNLLLAVFNMLPIPPLDGGNVLSALLPRRLSATFDQIRPYGFLLLYALILTSAYRYLVWEPTLFLRDLLP
jgi:Zn-dependent protease